MKSERIIETEVGIQDEKRVQAYNLMQRSNRDNGYLDANISKMIENGLNYGHALEVGQGPGYFGLEWLKATKDTMLTGIEISHPMVKIANINAKEYHMTDRVRYCHGDANKMHFEDETFDLVFSSFSMHEWANPDGVIKEIIRVLKKDGSLFIIDFRRDIDLVKVNYIPDSVQDEALRNGFFKSLNASYTIEELKQLFDKQKTGIKMKILKELEFGMFLIAKKI